MTLHDNPVIRRLHLFLLLTVVVTSLNREYPLIRFATGDLSAVMPGPSPCGRTNMRLRGWMGRADQAAKVKGMFITPKQIAAVCARHPEIARARLVIATDEGQDAMTLMCEVAGGDEALAQAVAETLRGLSNLKGTVEFYEPGSLPNDGIVIEDTRDRG